MTDRPSPPTGLRELKKHRTRRRIREEALQLFTRQGYEATTVEQIAAAAEVAPTTFFNYFPAKRDVLKVSDELVRDRLTAAIVEQPAGWPAMSVLCASVLEVGRSVDADHDRSSLLRQLCSVITSDPDLRSRSVLPTAELEERAVEVLVSSRSTDPAEASVVAAAVLAATRIALLEWAEGDEPLAEVMALAFSWLRGERSRRPPPG